MTKLFIEFFKTEKASGIVLIFCTLVSLVLANSQFSNTYFSIWELPILGHPFSYWINDGLMTFFFLMVGLEIEREIYVGELSQPRKALFPIVAAAGGMIVPALIHLSLNAGTETQGGAGIPMATDIAFALGVLSLLGNRVPIGLKVFLTAFAIIDDLGAIIVIASVCSCKYRCDDKRQLVHILASFKQFRHHDGVGCRNARVSGRFPGGAIQDRNIGRFMRCRDYGLYEPQTKPGSSTQRSFPQLI